MRQFLFPILTFFLLCGGCAQEVLTPPSSTQAGRVSLDRLGYTIQVGAFKKLDNAVRFSNALSQQGVNAYYFIHKSGLYKVRFGNFSSAAAARFRAKKIQATEIIDDFYIVKPESYAAARRFGPNDGYLREQIVGTAKKFIGIPYKWGGSSAAEGFDCSGLSMVAYRLNGLNLPRTSREQYRAGTPVFKEDLKNGDLVFFATTGKRKVSHVGIYAGRGSFIHAPKRGKRITVASLKSQYFRNHFVGARTYL